MTLTIRIGIACLAMLVATVGQVQAGVQLISNGGFETGDFTGWTVTDSGSGSWAINDGTFVPLGPGLPLAPISGSFDAVTFQGGPGLHLLTETIIVPDAVVSATFGWSDRIRNYGGSFSDPNQEWRVLVLDSGGSLLQEVFSTNPGDPLEQVGPNNRSFDLTSLFQSLQGQSIQISFEEQDNLGFFNVNLDDVSLLVETSVVPEPTSLAIFGLGALGLVAGGIRRRKQKA